jgi:6-phosphogluconolactonase
MSTLQIFSSKEELGQAVASLVARLSAQAINDRARFTVALSGGSLPKIVCPSLVNEPWRSQIDWPAWHVFWADERCVPLDHPDSNFRLARQQLFDQVEIPVAQIYPIDDSFEPDITAKAYEAVLKHLFKPAAGRPPRFDLVLLMKHPAGWRLFSTRRNRRRSGLRSPCRLSTRPGTSYS